MTTRKFRKIILTTPNVSGPDVRAIQRKLRVAPDGEYGKITAAAVKRWKFYAGYPLQQVNGMIGVRGQRWLFGLDKFPDDYVNRARTRRNLAYTSVKGIHPVKPIYAQAADQMVRWVNMGFTESPADSNVVPQLVEIAKTYGVKALPGMGAPWCEFSANLAALMHGGKGARSGLVELAWNAWYTVDAVHQASQGNFNSRIVGRDHAVYGAKTYFNFGSKDYVQHVGRLIEIRGNTVVTVDGNSSPHGSQDNGGIMCIRERSIDTVRAFVLDL